MTPFTDRTGRFSLLKTLCLLALAVPAVWIAIEIPLGYLAPLPIKEALHQTGLWAIRLLLVTLALTPAQRLLKMPKLALVRRMCGLAAVSYAAAHIVLYAAMLRFDLSKVVTEILQRRFLTLGIIAALGLAALAATSNDTAIRRLGRRWKTLHQAIYVIVPLGLLHFFMQAKIDVSAAVLLAGLFVLLMVYRLILRQPPHDMTRNLALSALAASAATAAIECLWYGLASGLSPARVALANLSIAHGVRPAVLVLLAGLCASAYAHLRNRTTSRPKPRILACVADAGVLETAPSRARSSAG